MKFRLSMLAAATLGAAALSAAVPAAAQTSGDSPWLIRVRAVDINTANKFDTNAAPVLPADSVHVSNKWIPEVDVSYFFTPNIAAELILTYPQRHDVYVTDGALAGTQLGTLKELPPTLTLQYHFTNPSKFTPYVGAGVNYTRFSSVNLTKALGDLDVKRSSFGPALQAGVSYALDKNWSINLDVKKVWMDTKVTLDGADVGKVKVDPWLFGLGVGYRF